MAAAIAMCGPAVLKGQVVTLAWEANSETDLAGYKVYWGTSSRTYPLVLDAGNARTLTIPNLEEGVTYYFAATAYNTDGVESEFSSEISHTILGSRPRTTGTLVSSANPAKPGDTVTFTFTVRTVDPATNTLSGLATFEIGESLSVVPLIDGVASFTTSTLPVGTHTVRAGYASDAAFVGITNRLSPDQVINTPPVVRIDEISRLLPNGAKVQISSLLTNDSDADGHALTLTSVAPRSAAGASVIRRSNWIYYVPPEGLISADSFAYSANDGLGAPVAGTVNVRVADPQPAVAPSVMEDGGSYRIRFDGAPGLTYRIEFSEPQATSWQELGTRAADEFGIFEVVDTPPPGSLPRTYRSIAIH